MRPSLQIWLADIHFRNKTTKLPVVLHRMVTCYVPLEILQQDNYFNRRCQRSYPTLKTELNQLETDPLTGYKKIVDVKYIQYISDSNLNYEQYLDQRTNICNNFV